MRPCGPGLRLPGMSGRTASATCPAHHVPPARRGRTPQMRDPRTASRGTRPRSSCPVGAEGREAMLSEGDSGSNVVETGAGPRIRIVDIFGRLPGRRVDLLKPDCEGPSTMCSATIDPRSWMSGRSSWNGTTGPAGSAGPGASSVCAASAMPSRNGMMAPRMAWSGRSEAFRARTRPTARIGCVARATWQALAAIEVDATTRSAER